MKKRRKRRKLKDVVFQLRRRVDQLGLEKTELVLEKAELEERLRALAELHERQVAGLLSRVEAEAAATARAKAERELAEERERRLRGERGGLEGEDDGLDVERRLAPGAARRAGAA